MITTRNFISCMHHICNCDRAVAAERQARISFSAIGTAKIDGLQQMDLSAALKAVLLVHVCLYAASGDALGGKLQGARFEHAQS